MMAELPDVVLVSCSASFTGFLLPALVARTAVFFTAAVEEEVGMPFFFTTTEEASATLFLCAASASAASFFLDAGLLPRR
jgi:hypothetical protein